MDCDILIIGGGVNGAGIARDAAGRGYDVVLAEKDDLASGTSSGSTKLIHGGLRYLEYYEFELVAKALGERERLMTIAPHIIWPLRFVIPHDRHQRPAWMIRLGLFLYDRLGRRERLPATEGIKFKSHPFGRILKGDLKRGFAYSDCWVDDARLVVLNAMDARERGADIRTRTAFVEAEIEDDGWRATLRDVETGASQSITARLIVNAAGPWAGKLLRHFGHGEVRNPLRLVKGSHIVVPRLYEEREALLLQNPDGRIVFVIPYEDGYSLIGTTEQDFTGDPDQSSISEAEVDYLIGSVGRHLRRAPRREDVVWTYSAVRPLFDAETKKASAVTRDYILDLMKGAAAPLISIYGGKITTYRVLAEQALDMIGTAIGKRGEPWTGRACLPGGDLPVETPWDYAAVLQRQFEWLPKSLAARWARTYGTKAEDLLDGAQALNDLGANLAGDLYAAEVDYLRRAEFAESAEDIMWRRTKLGLHLGHDGVEAVSRYLGRA